MDFEPVIGLEIHVELSTRSKMFCGCKVEFGGVPNTRTCPVCLAHPGALPVINRQAIRYLGKIGLSLECDIPGSSIFHRKNYFYPDLPKGYQISQYDQPFAVDGRLSVSMDGEVFEVGIERVHMEEDTAKNIHAGESGRIAGSLYSMIDFNRSGTPLVEIVTHPDINSPQMARTFLAKLKNLLLYLDVSDCNMEEGSLRCDANVSIRPKGTSEMGVKTELKNMNSFKHLEKGLGQEIKRQIALIEAGESVIQQTVHYDVVSDEISPLRSKEFAHDYRYFPEPDLVPLVASDEFVEEISAEMPELPDARAERYRKKFRLPAYDAQVITSNKDLANYFDETVSVFEGDSKIVSNWVMGELQGYLNTSGVSINECRVRPNNLVELLNMVDSGAVSATSGKSVFTEMCESGKSAGDIVKEKGLTQISDESELEALIEEVVTENPEQVKQYLAGKEKVIGFLVGQVMKKTGGRANPKLVNELLRSKIAG